MDEITSNVLDIILSKWSKILVLAQWSSITQGTYGASLKPKVQQLRVYPNDQPPTDECLLDYECEDGYGLSRCL